MDENEKEAELLRFLQEREAKRKGIEKSKTLAPTEKENLVKEASSPVKKNKMKRVDLILAVIFIAAFLIFFGWSSIMSEETGPVTVYPANVVLDSFDDGSNNPYIVGGSLWPVEIEIESDYVSVSFELKNTGDEDAADVSCFIKCCDQNGTILFAQLFMFDDLGPDAPGKLPYTRLYKVPISDETVYIVHDIDIRWSPQGVNTYVKLTEV